MAGFIAPNKFILPRRFVVLFRPLCLSKTGDNLDLSIPRIFPRGFATRYSRHYACYKTIGSFSNDIDDGNEDVKKAIDLLSKATTLHVHQTYFVHFLVAAA